MKNLILSTTFLLSMLGSTHLMASSSLSYYNNYYRQQQGQRFGLSQDFYCDGLGMSCPGAKYNDPFRLTPYGGYLGLPGLAGLHLKNNGYNNGWGTRNFAGQSGPVHSAWGGLRNAWWYMPRNSRGSRRSKGRILRTSSGGGGSSSSDSSISSSSSSSSSKSSSRRPRSKNDEKFKKASDFDTSKDSDIPESISDGKLDDTRSRGDYFCHDPGVNPNTTNIKMYEEYNNSCANLWYKDCEKSKYKNNSYCKSVSKLPKELNPIAQDCLEPGEKPAEYISEDDIERYINVCTPVWKKKCKERNLFERGWDGFTNWFKDDSEKVCQYVEEDKEVEVDDLITAEPVTTTHPAVVEAAVDSQEEEVVPPKNQCLNIKNFESEGEHCEFCHYLKTAKDESSKGWLDQIACKASGTASYYNDLYKGEVACISSKSDAKLYACIGRSLASAKSPGPIKRVASVNSNGSCDIDTKFNASTAQCYEEDTHAKLFNSTKKAAECLNLDSKELFKVINHESRYNINALSGDSSSGIGQVTQMAFNDLLKRKTGKGWNKSESCQNLKKDLVKHLNLEGKQKGDDKFKCGLVKAQGQGLGKDPALKQMLLAASFLSLGKNHYLKDFFNKSSKNCKAAEGLKYSSLGEEAKTKLGYLHYNMGAEVFKTELCAYVKHAKKEYLNLQRKKKLPKSLSGKWSYDFAVYLKADKHPGSIPSFKNFLGDIENLAEENATSPVFQRIMAKRVYRSANQVRISEIKRLEKDNSDGGSDTESEKARSKRIKANNDMIAKYKKAGKVFWNRKEKDKQGILNKIKSSKKLGDEDIEVLKNLRDIGLSQYAKSRAYLQSMDVSQKALEKEDGKLCE